MLSFTLLVRAGGNTAFTRYTKLDCVPLSVSIFWFETIVIHREKYYLIKDWGKKRFYKKSYYIVVRKISSKQNTGTWNLKNRPLQKMNFCLKTISLYAISLFVTKRGKFIFISKRNFKWECQIYNGTLKVLYDKAWIRHPHFFKKFICGSSAKVIYAFLPNKSNGEIIINKHFRVRKTISSSSFLSGGPLTLHLFIVTV